MQDTVELYGHQLIAKRAIQLAKRAHPSLDASPFLSIDERKQLHTYAAQALRSASIRVSFTGSASHAREATTSERAIAARCLDWMLLAGVAA